MTGTRREIGCTEAGGGGEGGRAGQDRQGAEGEADEVAAGAAESRRPAEGQRQTGDAQEDGDRKEAVRKCSSRC